MRGGQAAKRRAVFGSNALLLALPWLWRVLHRSGIDTGAWTEHGQPL